MCSLLLDQTRREIAGGTLVVSSVRQVFITEPRPQSIASGGLMPPAFTSQLERRASATIASTSGWSRSAVKRCSFRRQWQNNLLVPNRERGLGVTSTGVVS
jgi:hypothetical protein